MIQPSPFNSCGFIFIAIRGSKENIQHFVSASEIPLILISIAMNLLQPLQHNTHPCLLTQIMIEKGAYLRQNS
jgi:hypothetical protein